MWQEAEPLKWGGTEADLRDVRSAKRSKIVKFKPSLCANCNNARSQPFDRAWDTFAEFVWRSSDELADRQFLDLRVLYGENWREGAANLARYVAKHVGCRMVDDGFKPPNSLARFLDGEPLCQNTHMVTFFDRVLHNLEVGQRADGIDARGLWLAPANGAVSPTRGVLTAYGSALSVASVGIMYRWDADTVEVDPFYLHCKARLHDRSELPEW